MERLTSTENLSQEKARLKKQAEAKKLQHLKRKLTSNKSIDLSSCSLLFQFIQVFCL